MTQIWKYPLSQSQPMAEMPKGAKILCAREQGNNVCVWAEVNPDETEREKRWFDVYGTGHPIDDTNIVPRHYIGTASLMGGSLILHVFERRAASA